jgi:DNA-binding NarL/FixJ family response regulator
MANRTRSLRVVVVDDSASFRTLLVDYLQTQGAFDVVGSAADGLEAENVIDLTDPDVVILDVRLPRASGLELLSGLRRRHSQTMFVLNSCDDTTESEALRRGADLYLDKTTPFDEVCAAIRSKFR